jgi:vitamin B12 transporter
LIRRPKNSAGVNAGIRLNEKLFVSTNLSWFDKRQDAYFDAMTFQTVNITLDSYILIDVYAEYALFQNKLKIFADLRNVSDSKYSETAGFNTLGFNGYGGIRYIF